MLTELEKKVIAAIQKDIPIEKYPFLEIANKIGISENKLLEILQKLSDHGVIRRFGATLKHQKSGFSSNVMVAWKVSDERIDEVGEKLSNFDQVSHCYNRNSIDVWPYNLYTMVHGKDDKSCKKLVKLMSELVQVNSYKLLFSIKELKKTSMKYFHENPKNSSYKSVDK